MFRAMGTRTEDLTHQVAPLGVGATFISVVHHIVTGSGTCLDCHTGAFGCNLRWLHKKLQLERERVEQKTDSAVP